jgi:hypothetical protein
MNRPIPAHATSRLCSQDGAHNVRAKRRYRWRPSPFIPVSFRKAVGVEVRAATHLTIGQARPSGS